MFQKLGIRVGRKALLLGALILVCAGTQVGCFLDPLRLNVSAAVKSDPGGDAFFIDVPTSVPFSVFALEGPLFLAQELPLPSFGFVRASEFGLRDSVAAGDPIRLSAGNDFGTFEGELMRDGTFSATAIGTAAGFPGVEKKLNVTIDTATGMIVGTLEIGSNGALPSGQSITYDLTSQVEIPPGTPMFAFMPERLGFFSPVGQNPPDQTLKVENVGTGTLPWFVEVLTGQDFLSAGPVAGQAPLDVTVSVNSSTLTKGNHLGELEFTGFPEGGVLNSPVKVTVEYAVDTPYIPDKGIVPGDDFNGPLVAGGIASAFGGNLAQDVLSADMLPLPRTLNDTALLTGGGSLSSLRLPAPGHQPHFRSAFLCLSGPGQLSSALGI